MYIAVQLKKVSRYFVLQIVNLSHLFNHLPCLRKLVFSLQHFLYKHPPFWLILQKMRHHKITNYRTCFIL